MAVQWLQQGLRPSPQSCLQCIHLCSRLLNSSRVKLPLALELRPLSVRTTPQGGAPERQLVHVAWAGESSSSPGIIEIPSALASCLRLEPGSRLQVPCWQHAAHAQELPACTWAV